MIAPRTVKCGICGKEERELSYGSGWSGWGEVKGAILQNNYCDGEPHICPDHVKAVFDFLDGLSN